MIITFRPREKSSLPRSKNAEKEPFFRERMASLVIFNWGETNSFKGRSSGTSVFQRAMTRRGSHVNYPLRRDETFCVVHWLQEKRARLCWWFQAERDIGRLRLVEEVEISGETAWMEFNGVFFKLQFFKNNFLFLFSFFYTR